MSVYIKSSIKNPSPASRPFRLHFASTRQGCRRLRSRRAAPFSRSAAVSERPAAAPSHTQAALNFPCRFCHPHAATGPADTVALRPPFWIDTVSGVNHRRGKRPRKTAPPAWLKNYFTAWTRSPFARSETTPRRGSRRVRAAHGRGLEVDLPRRRSPAYWHLGRR